MPSHRKRARTDWGSTTKRVDKRLTKFLGSIQQLFLSCILPVLEFTPVLPRGRSCRSGSSEGAVKRDAHQFRPLSWFGIVLSICLTVLLFASIPAVAQSPSGADENPAGKGEEKPKEEAKAKDAAKSKEDVKKDTSGFVVKPLTGLHMDVDLALINVTVTDPYNRLVTGLDPDNFRVYEDNIEQEVVTFSSEDVPISIGVIFDFSGSMAN